MKHKARQITGLKMFQAVVLTLASIVVALNNISASEPDGLWKASVSGVSSKNGNTFVETVEYIGPTISSTNKMEKADREDNTYKPLPANLMLHTGHSRTKGTKFSAGYYRGAMVFKQGIQRNLPATISIWKTNLISVFSSPDLAILVIAVDDGPIYSSTNAGVAWTMKYDPGKHAYPLDTAPDGSGLFAEIYVPPGLVNSWPSQNWYANVSSKDGNDLILAENGAAPVLSIRHSNGTAIITWAFTQTPFGLQQSTDLTTTNWTDVNLMPTTDTGLNEVVISPVSGNQFYRLRKLE